MAHKSRKNQNQVTIIRSIISGRNMAEMIYNQFYLRGCYIRDFRDFTNAKLKLRKMFM